MEMIGEWLCVGRKGRCKAKRKGPFSKVGRFDGSLRTQVSGPFTIHRGTMTGRRSPLSTSVLVYWLGMPCVPRMWSRRSRLGSWPVAMVGTTVHHPCSLYLTHLKDPGQLRHLQNREILTIHTQGRSCCGMHMDLMNDSSRHHQPNAQSVGQPLRRVQAAAPIGTDEVTSRHAMCVIRRASVPVSSGRAWQQFTVPQQTVRSWDCARTRKWGI